MIWGIRIFRIARMNALVNSANPNTTKNYGLIFYQHGNHRDDHQRDEHTEQDHQRAAILRI
jgi:hypothetical protein